MVHVNLQIDCERESRPQRQGLLIRPGILNRLLVTSSDGTQKAPRCCAGSRQIEMPDEEGEEEVSSQRVGWRKHPEPSDSVEELWPAVGPPQQKAGEDLEGQQDVQERR